MKKYLLLLLLFAISIHSFSQTSQNNNISTNTNKYYTAHVMINLLTFTNDMKAWVQTMKDAGYNLIWAHLDGYGYSTYNATLASLMNAADTVGGIKVMPGWSMFYSQGAAQIIIDTWNHPALFKIDGKRVYSGWDYRAQTSEYDQIAVDNYLEQNAGISKSQYYLIVHSRYPYSYNYPFPADYHDATWVGEGIFPNGLPYWNGSSAFGYPGVTTDMNHLYDGWPFIDGLIDFAVDQSLASIINSNTHLATVGKARGKFSFAGISSFYASASHQDLGFYGAAKIWDSILILPIDTRPTGVSDITANDYAELSYMSPMVIPPVNGLSFIPPLNRGFTLGNSIRYPLTDHSGIQKFLRPWADAFLNNYASPTFPEDRMFAWYWLHPKDQLPDSTLPSIFKDYPHLNQEWWNSTVYATGNINVGGGNQAYGINTYLGDKVNKIRMAAHLTAPAQLKINDSLSELKPAGAAYFEINMDSFRGTPIFSIVRNGIEIEQGEGLQPITNNLFPGAWNFLATEIVPSTIKHNYYRSQSNGDWRNLNTWQSSTDSIKWSNAATIPTINSNNITIQNGHIITISDSATVDQLSIQKGGVLNVAHNASLIINDGPGVDIVINPLGNLIIQSDSIGTGRIGNSSGSISGNVTVERYILPSKVKSYRLLSTAVNTINGPKPFIRDNWQEGQNNTNIKNNINLVPHHGIHITGSTTGANGFDITTKGTVSLFTYNHVAETPSWIEATNTNATNLDAKTGYFVIISGDRNTDLRTNNAPSSTTLRATGTILTGTQIFTKPKGTRGTFLVTNPYPCPINWSTIYKDTSTLNSKNFENYYTYWDTHVGISGGYVTVNSNGVKSAPTNATIEIQSGQAFLIRIKKGIVSPTLTVKENHKSITSNLNVFRIAPQEQLMSSLYYATKDGDRIMADAVNTVFNNSFSPEVDENDAEEIANSEENIAINRANRMLSIEERPQIKLYDTLPLIIQRLKPQSYQWQFNPTGFTQQNLEAYLEDKFLNTKIPISLASGTIISFFVNSDPASGKRDRFRVLFALKRLPIVINSIKAYTKIPGIQVDWTSKSNVNLKSYEIEKSLDGIRFAKVQIVPIKVTGSSTDGYSWLDMYPKVGNNYYRIKTIDWSGILTYSKTVNIEFNNNNNGSFDVYPNPITRGSTTVRFNNISKGMYDLRLISNTGQVVFRKTIHHSGGSENQTISINGNLPSGNYILHITGNGINFNKQLSTK